MCSCCDHDFSLTVIANNAIATPTASPVTLTVDRPLTDMPAGGCFDLRVPKALLKNANVSPVQLSDGAVTLPLLTRCTDPLRYDSLVACAAPSPCGAAGASNPLPVMWPAPPVCPAVPTRLRPRRPPARELKMPGRTCRQRPPCGRRTGGPS